MAREYRMYGAHPTKLLAEHGSFVTIEVAGFVPEVVDVSTWRALPMTTAEEWDLEYAAMRDTGRSRYSPSTVREA